MKPPRAEAAVKIVSTTAGSRSLHPLSIITLSLL